MNCFDPILGQFMKRLRPMRNLEQAAVEVIEEHPAEEGPTEPIVFSDEDRSQVTGTYGVKSVEEEWKRVDGYCAHHEATTRYGIASSCKPISKFVTKAITQPLRCA